MAVFKHRSGTDKPPKIELLIHIFSKFISVYAKNSQLNKHKKCIGENCSRM